ncbi:MAG: SDR family oxidoreductase [Candidatus Korarchaeota archaeon]|nr:SDR family oxidoreductase [Candidatus Korarchaeota archaeon]NIU84494.1 glucose 1-dehydrogenase [Candidatus Thorarchaeota archaeon]NIW14561.1 glucose 1-dehydrogenase [Candidatus Thorarchaeota archaeon]NIW52633.1 glucose 1-dehydrogenase [Candidatus Korarchaeota archaeon]
MRLKGRKGIVTGSSRGIGRAIARGLAREGADVVINYHKSGEKAQKVAEKIRSMGRESLVIQADVTKKSAVKNMVKETMEAFNRIDFLVNNAGIVRKGPMEDLSVEEWDRVIDVNLRGPFLCSKYIGKQMIEQRGGSIVNISSISGLHPEIYMGAYSPSKAGLIKLSQVLAVEWAKYGIRVNAVCPGAVETPMMDEAYDAPTALKARTEAIPMKRFAKPEEIANLVVFLLSPEASYITGEYIVIDGGSVRSMYHLVHELRRHLNQK